MSAVGDMKAREGYVPYFKAAEPDLDFEKNYKWELISSFSRLHELLDDPVDQMVGADTETKTLDFSEKEPLVGYSFAFNTMMGYYVPLRHQYGGNLTPGPAVEIFHHFLLRNKVIGCNWPFDALMLKTEPTLDINPDAYRVFDIMCLIFNADTNVKRNNLKFASLYYAGRKSPTFEEMMAKVGEGKGRWKTKPTFDMLPPEDAAFYASQDACNNLAIYYKLMGPLKKECGTILKIDNALSKALPFYLSNPVFLDNARMMELAKETKLRIRHLENAIFKEVGFPFIIDSKRSLGQALLTLGVDTGIKTMAGDMKLDEKSLSKIDHPIVKMVIERNSLVKQLGSYIDKTTQKPEGRFQLQIARVPSGRLASGNKDTDEDTGNPYFLKLNSQNLTKPDAAYYRVEEGKPEDPETILGYKFTLMDPEVYKKDIQLPRDGSAYIEGMSPVMNVRNAITVPNRNNFYYVGIDFCLSKTTEIETRYGKKLITVVRDSPGIEIKTPEGFKRAYNYRVTGLKKKCRITLKSGKVLVCSEDHVLQVRTVDGEILEKKVIDILPSDNIVESD